MTAPHSPLVQLDASDSSTFHYYGTEWWGIKDKGGRPGMVSPMFKAWPAVNVGGAWKDIDSVHVNVGGVWKDNTDLKVNVGGAWKQVAPVMNNAVFAPTIGAINGVQALNFSGSQGITTQPFAGTGSANRMSDFNIGDHAEGHMFFLYRGDDLMGFIRSSSFFNVNNLSANATATYGALAYKVSDAQPLYTRMSTFNMQSGTWTGTSAHIIHVSTTATKVTLEIDGIVKATQVPKATYVGIQDHFRIQIGNTVNVPAKPATLDFGECLVYAALTAAEVTDVLDYLKKKWKIGSAATGAGTTPAATKLPDAKDPVNLNDVTTAGRGALMELSISDLNVVNMPRDRGVSPIFVGFVGQFNGGGYTMSHYGAPGFTRDPQTGGYSMAFEINTAGAAIGKHIGLVFENTPPNIAWFFCAAPYKGFSVVFTPSPGIDWTKPVPQSQLVGKELIGVFTAAKEITWTLRATGTRTTTGSRPDWN